ncbi:DinB family protein [Terrimonas pollutisoli]|uniref:DinB family protein n=1 Tax=Terrimonas pollutisoli TaxID=3034147 RepID=UPI0023EDF58D|nr:DinB family protein [Terrimonas sp. H1YJ31]
MSFKTNWQTDGFFAEETNIGEAMNRLSHHIEGMESIYATFSPEQLLQKPAPGKWSKQEILGHLVDSAINNLKRFTEIQFLPQPYQVVSYRQNELVAVNAYQQLPLQHLLELWKALNQQIIYVVQNIPAEKLNYAVDPQYDNKELKTLGWIICDYVAHLEHHLAQIKA